MTRGRGKLTPQDKLDMQKFAIRLNSILSERNCTQAELTRQTKIPPSTITGYVKGTSLPVSGNVQKIADFFGLLKSDIDPRFKSDKSITAPKNVSDEVLRLDKGLHQDNRKNWIRYGNELLEKQNTAESSKNTVADNVIQLFPYDQYDQPASAGTGQYLNDVRVQQVELPIEVDADFVIPIYSDSMEPEYHSGDYVFVKLTYDLSDGDIGVLQ